MTKYIIKRLLYSILILFCVSLIIYFLVRLLPTDFVTQKFRSQLDQGTVSQEDIDAMLKLYGLYDNSFTGILKGYWGWLTSALKGDFGISFKFNDKVSTVITTYMWISFTISAVALVL